MLRGAARERAAQISIRGLSMWGLTMAGPRPRDRRRTLRRVSTVIAVAAPVTLIGATTVSADVPAGPATGSVPTLVTAPVSSEPTANVGDTVTFSTTVSGEGAINGGTVTFSASGVTICTSGTVGADGLASCAAVASTAGTYSVIATYSGDATYAPSTSSATTETVGTPTTSPAPSGGSITQTLGVTTSSSTTEVPAPTTTVVETTPTVTSHKVAKKTTKPLTLNYLRIVPAHVHWCGTCSYPNATIEFSLSKAAEVRMRLYAPVDGKEQLVHTDTLNGHRGANRFRLAGRWKGQLVPKRGVHIVFAYKVNGRWITKKTIPVSVASRFPTVPPKH
jgi:hypothetical protein